MDKPRDWYFKKTSGIPWREQAAEETPKRAKRKSITIIADRLSGREITELRRLYPYEEFELTIVLQPFHKETDHERKNHA